MHTHFRFTALLSFLCIWFLSSCSVEEKTRFNADFSGTCTTVMDMKLMVELLQAKDTTGQLMKGFMDGFQKGMKKELAQFPDMKVSYDSVQKQLITVYSFANLEKFNEFNAMAREKGQEGKPKKKQKYVNYVWKTPGKVLVMPGVEGVEEWDELLKDQKDAAEVKQKITYTIVREFPKEIASVSDNRVQVSSDKKTMTLQANAAELLKKPLKEVIVTFKN